MTGRGSCNTCIMKENMRDLFCPSHRLPNILYWTKGTGPAQPHMQFRRVCALSPISVTALGPYKPLPILLHIPRSYLEVHQEQEEEVSMFQAET